ncbi:unnamed protein product [Ilex paraguariensis]
MASHGGITVTTSSPKGGSGRESLSGSVNSPKGQCLCSPTTHKGSFRCRFHRSSSTAWLKRSKSMPPSDSVSSLSPKSVEST